MTNEIEKGIIENEAKIKELNVIAKNYRRLAASEVIALEVVRSGMDPTYRRNVSKSSALAAISSEVRQLEASNVRFAAYVAENAAKAAVVAEVVEEVIEETTILNGEVINIADYLKSIGC